MPEGSLVNEVHAHSLLRDQRSVILRLGVQGIELVHKKQEILLVVAEGNELLGSGTSGNRLLFGELVVESQQQSRTQVLGWVLEHGLAVWEEDHALADGDGVFHEVHGQRCEDVRLPKAHGAVQENLMPAFLQVLDEVKQALKFAAAHEGEHATRDVETLHRRFANKRERELLPLRWIRKRLHVVGNQADLGKERVGAADVGCNKPHEPESQQDNTGENHQHATKQGTLSSSTELCFELLFLCCRHIG